MVVILAAGKGSRMKNLPKGVSKCATVLPDGRTPIRRLIDQFKSLGEYNFTVIVGYGAESVINGVGESKGEFVNFIYNGKYETRGCEYSLSLSAPVLNPDEDLIIVEGDLVTTKNNLETIFDHEGTSVLVRSGDCLSSRSVAVLCDDKNTRVLKFIYDQLHAFDMNGLSKIKPSCRVHDSFQIWKIAAGSDLEDFKSLLELYRANADSLLKDQEYQFASGLLSINEFITTHEMKPLWAIAPGSWINMNSEDDLNRLNNDKDCPWFYPLRKNGDLAWQR